MQIRTKDYNKLKRYLTNLELTDFFNLLLKLQITDQEVENIKIQFTNGILNEIQSCKKLELIILKYKKCKTKHITEDEHSIEEQSVSKEHSHLLSRGILSIIIAIIVYVLVVIKDIEIGIIGIILITIIIISIFFYKEILQLIKI
jgi:hypothetical protein